jgi:hypothetical protein
LLLSGGAVLGGGGAIGCSDPSAGSSGSASPRCVAPEGVSSSPESISETVALLNALPRPVTLPCFLSALDRPLAIHATRSVISAQPAAGERSPRIFLFLGKNILSVVPDGEGAHLLEFGEQLEGHRSVKAELAFPIVDELTEASPFEHLMFDESVTTCGLCHSAERRDPAYPQPGAFVSQALRPRVSDQISVARLEDELRRCEPRDEPDRCAFLEALLGWGDVVDTYFPEDMDTIFGD